MKRKRKVSSRVFKFTLDLMAKHLKFEAAGNSIFSSRDIHSCLVHLSLNEGYAEGGMANLSSKCGLPNSVPTGRTFRNRVERVETKEVRRSLNEANDEVLRTLKSLGIFRRRAVVVIDYVRKPYYGDPNAEMLVGGPYLTGTPWYHCYVSIHSRGWEEDNTLHHARARIQRFTLGRGDRVVGFHLAIYPKPREKAEKSQRLYDRYLTFATNISKPRAGQFSILIPQEYRRRWGIETGFRVQGTIEAKTTSKNHVLRLLYHMYSVVLYNIWQYANLLLSKALKKPRALMVDYPVRLGPG
jgi:hypothetical protein